MTIVATLTAPDGTTHPLDRTVGVGRDYASRGGRVHKVLLPPTLGAGRHQLVVESTLGRTTIVRELTLTVLLRGDALQRAAGIGWKIRMC
jgi:hypothetical protein